MKKARLMLAMIAVFGGLGGAIAFRASNFVNPKYYCTYTTQGLNYWVLAYNTMGTSFSCAGYSVITTLIVPSAPFALYGSPATYYYANTATKAIVFFNIGE